ncbi:putative uncharacterized protein [Pseudomonas sp. StFLB209]|uniref:hypothetical protein n=1 Tax=Pseudomonas sp. StFLB209 TaxID=1028989 RepID=UPI0004F7480A|nr:hypothetical protein [Pseudomonas sp. StFLB209]BAP43923.1 putative uncharacterized protein [Pseudomonas sp. StFLB209]
MSQVKIAYLEISGRMTGKTERLAEMASELAAQGRTVIFVVWSPRAVLDLGCRHPGLLVIADGQPLPAGVDPETAVWFYDEFDYLKSAVVRPGAYYSTTPRYLRVAGEPAADKDVLLQLLEANGYRYDRYVMPPYISSDGQFYREHRLNRTPEQFRMHMFGEFLS